MAKVSLQIDLENRARRALTAIGEYMLIETDDCFREERSPDGQPWEPLKQSTPQLYRRRFGRSPSVKSAQRYEKNRKILTDTGRLRNSIIYEIKIPTVEIGTNVIYAATHNFGDPARNIPARPFLRISPRQEAEILRLVEDFLGT